MTELPRSTDGPLRVGILGAGGIATVSYGVLPNIHHFAETVTIAAIADVEPGLAKTVAERFDIPLAFDSLEAMLHGAELDAIANLTPIPVHYETNKAALANGLHVVSEKPLASTLEQADELIELAESMGLTLACAPPDMLFEPYERAAELLRAGAIGRVAFARVCSSHGGPGGGPDGWPSDPTWFYQEGSGPLFDMGVYGIHEITGLLGPAKRVVAFSGITDPVRVVRGGPFEGLEIPVTVADNNLFMLDFGESKFAVIDGTFNVLASAAPKIEIFGRRGVLNILTPGGPALSLYRADAAPGVDGWIEPDGPLAEDHRNPTYGRAIMVGHLAECVAKDKKPIISAEHARHALEIMLAVERSAVEGRAIELTTTF